MTLKAFLDTLKSKRKDTTAEAERLATKASEMLHEAFRVEHEARLAKAFGYARVSHRDSADSGLSLEYQETAIRRYTAFLQETVRPDLQWGGMFVDKVVSAFTTPLVLRKAGREMNAVLKRGDLVVIYHIDRGFRNTKDLLVTLDDIWGPRGVDIAFVEPTINTSSPFGRFMLISFVASAELESTLKSEKNRDIKRSQVAKGYAMSKPAFGFKNIGPKSKRRSVPDETQRDIARLVLYLRDVEHFDWLSMRPHAAALDQAIKGLVAPRIELFHLERMKTIYRAGKKMELTPLDTRIPANHSPETAALIKRRGKTDS